MCSSIKRLTNVLRLFFISIELILIYSVIYFFFSFWLNNIQILFFSIRINLADDSFHRASRVSVINLMIVWKITTSKPIDYNNRREDGISEFSKRRNDESPQNNAGWINLKPHLNWRKKKKKEKWKKNAHTESEIKLNKREHKTKIHGR